MKYTLSFGHPEKQLIGIEIETETSGEAFIDFFAPKWRPGRYEIGPYSQNIVDFSASDNKGNSLSFQKTAWNAWRVHCPRAENITVSYKYYANQIDGGSSFFDDRLIYINGVNLFLFRKDKLSEPCSLKAGFPFSQTATSLQFDADGICHLPNFHELVDAPIISSDSLKSYSYTESGVEFLVWFEGDVHPDENKLIREFKAFTKTQIELFGEFPVKKYHFLNIIRQDKFYHGVEHQESTVIVLGPAARFHEADIQENFLGVSSHELFHTWNVKALRPKDMVPYDYDRENYSAMHYVTEGVTTYYGDLMLWKSDVWSFSEFLSVFNSQFLNRHYANTGYEHISLEAASFDSWLNGYKAGVPDRKISFYTKGALVTWLLDYSIRKDTQNGFSMDDVMREMYQRYGKNRTGYTKENYLAVISQFANRSYEGFFNDFITGTANLLPLMKEAAAYFGLKLTPAEFSSPALQYLGLRTDESSGDLIINYLYPESPAEKAGLIPGDILVAVDGRQVKGMLESVISQLKDSHPVKIHLFRRGRLIEKTLTPKKSWAAFYHQLQIDESAEEAALRNREAWHSVKTSKILHES